jgi:dihydrofolate reductase
MGSIVVTEFVSLDGVMDSPGGDNNFERGAWAMETDRGEEGNAFKTGETMDAAAMLLGRKTYEAFATAWTPREGEFADQFNNMPKYVVSSTLEGGDWGPTTVLGGDDLAAAVREARDEHERHLIVHGSRELVQWLIEEDLVDELRLMMFPVVVGYGRKLFGDTSDKRKLELAESNVVGDGVVTLVYRRPS